VLAGTLRPRAQVELVAELQARLMRVVRDEGARVAAGELLAVLDPTDYRLSNERAKAALAVAEANRSHALAEKERAESLLKTGGITAKDNLSAQVALQVAEASVAQVKAESAIAAQQLARTEIRAPFAGRVAKRHADPGSMLTSGTRVFTFVDDAVLEFRAPVPSAQFGKARLGAAVEVQVDAGLRPHGEGPARAHLADRRRAHALVRGDGGGAGGRDARRRPLCARRRERGPFAGRPRGAAAGAPARRSRRRCRRRPSW
jgi:RND family efflux transporter MFP subunit